HEFAGANFLRETGHCVPHRVKRWRWQRDLSRSLRLPALRELKYAHCGQGIANIGSTLTEANVNFEQLFWGAHAPSRAVRGAFAANLSASKWYRANASG